MASATSLDALVRGVLREPGLDRGALALDPHRRSRLAGRHGARHRGRAGAGLCAALAPAPADDVHRAADPAGHHVRARDLRRRGPVRPRRVELAPDDRPDDAGDAARVHRGVGRTRRARPVAAARGGEPGASWPHVLWRIELPLLRGSIVAGALSPCLLVRRDRRGVLPLDPGRRHAAGADPRRHPRVRRADRGGRQHAGHRRRRADRGRPCWPGPCWRGDPHERARRDSTTCRCDSAPCRRSTASASRSRRASSSPCSARRAPARRRR